MVILDLENLVCFDVETTGLKAFGSDRDEILTLSICDGYGRPLFDRMFKPLHKTSWPSAERVNGISPEAVEACPAITEYSDEIQSIFDGAEEVIGYNIGFDLGFLSAAGIVVDEAKYKHEPMFDFAEVYGAYDKFHDDWKWQKLTKAAEYIGYDWGETKAHSSMADVLASLALAKWLYDDGNLERVRMERISYKPTLKLATEAHDMRKASSGHSRDIVGEREDDR